MIPPNQNQNQYRTSNRFNFKNPTCTVRYVQDHSFGSTGITCRYRYQTVSRAGTGTKHPKPVSICIRPSPLRSAVPFSGTGTKKNQTKPKGLISPPGFHLFLVGEAAPCCLDLLFRFLPGLLLLFSPLLVFKVPFSLLKSQGAWFRV